tara:strand:+ start:136 stop:426 length:291 start_codon:yes stop_codon:yes gene_type:complete
MYQVKWFSKKKGYGFVEDSTGKEYFVHHTDIQVSDGFRYLREGEYVEGMQAEMDDNKVKIAQIRAPMENGKLMCEVERRSRRLRPDEEGSHVTAEA